MSSAPGSTGHYNQDELLLVAMQLLSRAEHADAIAHVADCPYCRLELAAVQGGLAAYAHMVESHSPPAFVRERILNRLPREKRILPAESEPIDVSPQPEALRSSQPDLAEESASSRLRELSPQPEIAAIAMAPDEAIPLASYGQKKRDSDRLVNADEITDSSGPVSLFHRVVTNIFGWTGWVAAGALAAVVGNLYHQRESQRTTLATQAAELDRRTTDSAGARQLLDTITDATAQQVTLSPALDTSAPATPQGRVIYIARKGSLIFLASNLEPLEEGKTYQLWLIPGSGRDPIPAGAFRPDTRGNASIVLPPIPRGVEARSFGVTIEDGTGSQTPTMPMVLAGN